jgi:predicted SAM-dependent methyltransferase
MLIINSIKNIFRPLRDWFRLIASYSKLRLTPASKNINLEIGSGPVKRQGWLTLDMCKGADVYWDMRFGLPFKSETFKTLYCSHVLEHFSHPDLLKLLAEIHRILKPGGEFLIAVPDASLFVEAYLGKRDPIELIDKSQLSMDLRRMDILNYIFYMDGHHKFMFDSQNISFHCLKVGFTSCRPRAFDPSLDQKARDYESLYMICTK